MEAWEDEDCQTNRESHQAEYECQSRCSTATARERFMRTQRGELGGVERHTTTREVSKTT
jgi:hypothetical protein